MVRGSGVLKGARSAYQVILVNSEGADHRLTRQPAPPISKREYTLNTIAVANQKGGVGKTLLSVSLASLLAAEEGCDVLLVDTDSQGNIAKWFDLSEESGLYDLLIKETPITNLVREVPLEKWWPGATNGRLYILPGNKKTTTAGTTLALNREPDDILRLMLEPLRSGSTAHIIIDTSPTITTLMANVLVAADHLIVPTAPEVLSVNGVTKTVEEMQDPKITAVRGSQLDILGIVPNKVHRNAEHRNYLEEIRKRWPSLIYPSVPYYVALEKAPSFGCSIFAYAPKSKAAAAMRQIGYSLLDQLYARKGAS